MKLYVKFNDQFKNLDDVREFFATQGLRVDVRANGDNEAFIVIKSESKTS